MSSQTQSDEQYTLFIVEAEDLDDSNPYQVTMLEHPPDSAQATAVEEAMRQLVETAEKETGERHRLVTEVDTPAVTEANYEMHTELLESEELVTDGGRDLGVACDVDDCETRVVGIEDGWEVSRGTVCQDCLDYRDRHGHWPDEDPDICVECRLDEGAIRHECDEAAVDAVILNPGSDCDFCGFKANVATDGGRDIDYDEPPEIPDPPMYPEWEDVETWSTANLRYPVPGGWEIADHGKFHTTWEHEDGTELTRSSKRTPGQKDTFAFHVDNEKIHSVDAGPERAKMREETVWLLQFYDENGIESVEEFEVEVRKERNQSLDEFATDGGEVSRCASCEREIGDSEPYLRLPRFVEDEQKDELLIHNTCFLMNMENHV